MEERSEGRELREGGTEDLEQRHGGTLNSDRRRDTAATSFAQTERMAAIEKKVKGHRSGTCFNRTKTRFLRKTEVKNYMLKPAYIVIAVTVRAMPLHPSLLYNKRSIS